MIQYWTAIISRHRNNVNRSFTRLINDARTFALDSLLVGVIVDSANRFYDSEGKMKKTKGDNMPYQFET